jgi:hypothetical protein
LMRIGLLITAIVGFAGIVVAVVIYNFQNTSERSLTATTPVVVTTAGPRTPTSAARATKAPPGAPTTVVSIPTVVTRSAVCCAPPTSSPTTTMALPLPAPPSSTTRPPRAAVSPAPMTVEVTRGVASDWAQYRGEVFLTDEFAYVRPEGKKAYLSGDRLAVTGVSVDDVITITANGHKWTHDFSNNCSGTVDPIDTQDLSWMFPANQRVTVKVVLNDKCFNFRASSAIYVVDQ